MNMDKLLPSEIMQIDGAGWRSNMAEFVDTGSVIGTVIGYAPTGTLIGADQGGLIGAVGGFSAGLGWGIGTLIRERIIYPYARIYYFFSVNE
ncbi:hypothetical protein D1605_003040 [Xylella fastidiosa subsp. fastidiosa]|uniref:Uncharacterized protein n=2 Tax=Xylella fastidiosa TaxID=2371 RepID=B2I954_XYLF2|nr:hypothetical protein [Xylella fastidiosa]AIC13566.1 hypothetical protein P303_02345 [Xylella fastidiosa MUL0034]EGO81237.1 hypothetical protein XFEB_01925 [Xylella fastidiosa EB92.1]KAF0571501.1 hypothetical protein P305_04110 [Xylella fastidiosa subsp. fastidiosa Mus-1]ACB92029.1 hypothetical protein XfasM23_0585 [Xylella fastidiosa M23]KGM20753.1 membrane protein [Xylella fastidiosa]